MSESNYTLQTLSRALDVLELIEASSVSMTLTEIAAKMNEKIPVVYRILQTLEMRGYLRRGGLDKRYTHTGRTTGTGSVKRAIDILRKVAEFSPHYCSPVELSQQSGLDVDTVTELLSPLVEKGLVEQIMDGNRFRLSYSMLEIVRFLLQDSDYTAYIRPLMYRLRDKTGETLCLFQRSGNRQVAVAVVPSLHPVRYVIDIGASFPLHRGAAGKAALATLSEKEIHRLLHDNKGRDQIVDIERLEADLAAIRDKGYALSSGERYEGTTAVAIALHGLNDERGPILSLMMPTSRATPEKLHKYGEIMVEEAKALVALVDRGGNGNHENNK
ncbi:IclR family transcriptional regulator domain-containing protein [Desulforhopalus singaporensis]|uniref:Transcriptional regulator, IclR family n=1 Tax=Desulforhopalus singaporensis TaxID=91360 RepID=A0A1H0V1E4_9BACT|nr:IclR family transcriptional regulator C-terminal domain-containing protein [Desulforhopalus singaporensis]SDP72379.1 transcriptional regulator, IclR family [Desulforhopalus singaporensis]